MQNGDDIIVVVMLKFRQILVVSYLFHPANLENDIFKKTASVKKTAHILTGDFFEEWNEITPQTQI